MNKFKFRVWDTDLKNWRYLDSIFNMPAPEYKGDDYQFTGMLDKNDKEIYGGSIVKTEQGIGYVSYMNETADYIVDFWKEGQTKSKGEVLSSFSDIEIIGDTYQNPELLK